MNDHSPAPSKEMKETKEKIWDCIIRYASTCMGEHDRVLTLSDKRTAIGKEIDELWSSLAAEIGKEREAEVATLRAELADRWRDITANEQQTQRLLNDIENLRAEIAELKARP